MLNFVLPVGPAFMFKPIQTQGPIPLQVLNGHNSYKLIKLAALNAFVDPHCQQFYPSDNNQRKLLIGIPENRPFGFPFHKR